MIGEKIMACNRRLGGSAKDIYDLYLWAARPFSREHFTRAHGAFEAGDLVVGVTFLYLAAGAAIVALSELNGIAT